MVGGVKLEAEDITALEKHARPCESPACLDWLHTLQLDDGMVDTFAARHPLARRRATCWEQYRARRYENAGTRIDYLFVDEVVLMLALRVQFCAVDDCCPHRLCTICCQSKIHPFKRAKLEKTDRWRQFILKRPHSFLALRMGSGNHRRLKAVDWLMVSRLEGQSTILRLTTVRCRHQCSLRPSILPPSLWNDLYSTPIVRSYCRVSIAPATHSRSTVRLVHVKNNSQRAAAPGPSDHHAVFHPGRSILAEACGVN